MPEEKSDEYRWGKVFATLDGIEKKTDAVAKSASEAMKSRGELHKEVTAGFLTVNSEISGLTQKVDSHLSEDDRRFETVGTDIRRLEDNGGVPGLAKPAGAAAGGGVLVLVLNWLREIFMNGGTQPPHP